MLCFFPPANISFLLSKVQLLFQGPLLAHFHDAIFPSCIPVELTAHMRHHDTDLAHSEIFLSLQWLQPEGHVFNLVGTPHQVRSTPIKSITFAGQAIPLSAAVINLGVRMDSHMTFDTHIKHLCKDSFFHLRNLAKHRLSLSLPDAGKLVLLGLFCFTAFGLCCFFYLCLTVGFVLSCSTLRFT